MEGSEEELSGARTKGRRSTLHQHLRARRRGHLHPLARHLAAILCQRLQDEEQLRPVRGLAHRLQRLGSLVRPGRTRARRGGGRARPGGPRHSLRRRLRLSNAANLALARRRGRRRCAGKVHRGRARGLGNGRPEKADPRDQHSGRAQFAALRRPPRLRRQHQLHSDLPDPGQVRSHDYAQRSAR